MDHILSSGSGRGRIAFFDLRANDYISVQPEALSRPQSPVLQHPSASPTDAHIDSQTDGWLDDDEYGDNDEYGEYDDIDDSDTDDADQQAEEDWQLMAFQPSGASFRRTIQMPRMPGMPAGPSRRSCFLQTGVGWLNHNHVYM